MNKPKYVFSQLVAFMDSDKFRHIVDKYRGNRYVKHFTCWNQLLTLMFGQLSNRESLRDLIIAIEAHHQKCYHLGLGKHVTRSNLGKANTNRDYRIFEEYAYYLVSEARRKRATEIFKLDGKQISSSLTVTSMLSIPRPSRYAWMSSGGLSSASIRVVSRYIPCMTWKLRFLPFSTSPRHQFMIPRR